MTDREYYEKNLAGKRYLAVHAGKLVRIEYPQNPDRVSAYIEYNPMTRKYIPYFSTVLEGREGPLTFNRHTHTLKHRLNSVQHIEAEAQEEFERGNLSFLGFIPDPESYREIPAEDAGIVAASIIAYKGKLAVKVKFSDGREDVFSYVRGYVFQNEAGEVIRVKTWEI